MRNKQVGPTQPVIDGQVLSQIFRNFAGLLAQTEQLLNDLNVFPVPDSDTGTNSLLTIQAGLTHIDKGKKSAFKVAGHMATDAGQSARGNSGVILAEYLRGFADVAVDQLDSNSLHICLVSAESFAHSAVATPRDGTMLSVARSIAALPVTKDLGDYISQLSKTARMAVHDSTAQLDELKAAGVVDAGALALSMFFDAIHEVVNGTKQTVIELAQTSCDVHAIDYRGPDFEVMFNFAGDAQSLREELAVLGESLTVTGPATQSRFHIHVDNPTEAILEAMRHGVASRIVINQLTQESGDEATSDGVGVVIALEGAGLIQQATDLGAQCVSASSDVSVAEFESAIRNSGQRNVIVLTSAIGNQAAAAIAAHNARSESITARIIPTRTIPHSFAALAVFDSSADLKGNLEAMARASHTTRSGCVLVNAVGIVEGYIDGNLFESSAQTSANDMLAHVVDALLDDGGDLVTVLIGQTGDSDSHVHLMADHVGTDFDFIQGGQASSVYLVGVE